MALNNSCVAVAVNNAHGALLPKQHLMYGISVYIGLKVFQSIILCASSTATATILDRYLFSANRLSHLRCTRISGVANIIEQLPSIMSVTEIINVHK
jgi:hypothetical protein